MILEIMDQNKANLEGVNRFWIPQNTSIINHPNKIVMERQKAILKRLRWENLAILNKIK